MALVTRVSRDAIISAFVDPIMKLMKEVIREEDNRQILQTDLRRMESLVEDTSTLFGHEVDITSLFHDQQETVKIWLQLLQNSLTEAQRLLSIDRSGSRQRCLDCLACNPGRLSNDIRDWNALFDQLYHGFQSELSMLLTSLEFASSRPLHIEEELIQDEADSGLVGSGSKDAEAQVERWLKEGDRVHLIGVYGMPGIGKTSLLKKLYNKYKNEVSKAFQHVIWVTVSQDDDISELQRRIKDELPLDLPFNLEERETKLSAYLKRRKFLLVLDGLWSPLDLQELGVEFGDGINSKVIFSTQSKDLIGEMSAEESIEIQPLSRDEGWMLFRRVAFKDEHVSMDIEERARRFAEECKGVPFAIETVAKMIGQTSVDKWDACFSLKENVDPSFPATHPGGLDAHLYTLLRWCYDALPNSEVRNCFLYCAMFPQNEEIDGRQLVQMWIGEGLVKSKQGSHVMDMAIGRKYFKLLLDRCFFQIARNSTNVFRNGRSYLHDVIPSVRVHHHIRDLAVYIGQKEENCLFLTRQNVRNFPEVHNENCRRISVADNFIEDLPSELRFPKLACLSLKGNSVSKELSSGFVLSLTSLRVLNLSDCTNITSVPTSVGQLRLLEFLSLRDTAIEALPDEICHLSRLQFLDLSETYLQSLPSRIGQLKHLKHLNLDFCSLEMIPREISELTSLSRLQLYTDLSVETEAQASIWSLKGLKNLTELKVWIKANQDKIKWKIKEGIMGTWLEMRHLNLCYSGSSDEIMEDLPRDMQNMRKLQSLMLWGYNGLNLPNCKFEHLGKVELRGCSNIRELSRLEWLPNLKLLKLQECGNLRELGIGSSGRVRSGYLMLEKLVLKGLEKLESLGGASNTGVWDETTLPHLRVLKIFKCKKLKRFPVGMEKLRKLKTLMVHPRESIMWEDDCIKVQFQHILKEYIPSRAYWSLPTCNQKSSESLEEEEAVEELKPSEEEPLHEIVEEMPRKR